jgi:TadE-like protein
MKRASSPAKGAARGRRGRSDRGAVLVESALILPFVFAILFGIIDFGNTFNDYISVRQGARDGLRMALVDTSPDNPGGGAWNCPEGGGSSIPAVGSDGYALMCFTKLRVGLDQNRTAVKLYFTGSYAAGQPVKMCVAYRASSITGAYSTILDTKIMRTDVESLIEQASTTISAFEESSFPGGGPAVSWPSSCQAL